MGRGGRARMKKTKARNRNKVRSVEKSLLRKIKRIYAEHGLVHSVWEDGTETTLTVHEAASRAQKLNAMKIPDALPVEQKRQWKL